VRIWSDTDPIGIYIDLEETAAASGIYTGTLRIINTTSSSGMKELKVDGGDSIQLDDVSQIGDPDTAWLNMPDINNVPVALAGDIQNADSVYPNVSLTWSCKYSDFDGYADLDTMYFLFNQVPDSDILFRINENGAIDSGAVSIDSGSTYVDTATYYYTTSGNDLFCTFTFRINWTWYETNTIAYAVQAADSADSFSSWNSTASNKAFVKVLGLYGTLSNDKGITSGSWTKSATNVTWSGLTVYFRGSTVSPSLNDFDLRLTNDDGFTSDQTNSEILNKILTVDASQDTSRHSVDHI